MTPEQTSAPSSEIVAKASSYYRNTRYLIVAMLILYGGWSLRDGFIKYPRENAVALAADPLLDPRKVPHPGWDVPFNRWIGILAPPAGLAMLFWSLYKSRGEYRLSGNTIAVPGHPPVTLDQLRRLDSKLWNRKGIAYVEYERPQGGVGRFKLDDFVYQRPPTDAIYKQIEARLNPQLPPAVAAATALPPPPNLRQQQKLK